MESHDQTKTLIISFKRGDVKVNDIMHAIERYDDCAIIAHSDTSVTFVAPLYRDYANLFELITESTNTAVSQRYEMANDTFVFKLSARYPGGDVRASGKDHAMGRSFSS